MRPCWFSRNPPRLRGRAVYFCQYCATSYYASEGIFLCGNIAHWEINSGPRWQLGVRSDRSFRRSSTISGRPARPSPNRRLRPRATIPHAPIPITLRLCVHPSSASWVSVTGLAPNPSARAPPQRGSERAPPDRALVAPHAPPSHQGVPSTPATARN